MLLVRLPSAQVLHLGKRGHSERTLNDFKLYLDDYAYDKIWSELPANNWRVALGIAESESGAVAEIRQILNMETNAFNPYCERLIKKDLVNGEARGRLSLTLPLFEGYVIEHSRRPWKGAAMPVDP